MKTNPKGTYSNPIKGQRWGTRRPENRIKAEIRKGRMDCEKTVKNFIKTKSSICEVTGYPHSRPSNCAGSIRTHLRNARYEHILVTSTQGHVFLINLSFVTSIKGVVK